MKLTTQNGCSKCHKLGCECKNPKSLDQIRDELTQEYMQAFDPNDDHSYLAERGFGHGFDAAIKVLVERAGKFDDKAAIKASGSHDKSWTSEVFVDGARWQHQQDMAALELERERGRMNERMEQKERGGG